MVLTDVAKKNVLDDVFWMALYNMSINFHEGDTDKFYDVLIPFLTGKPLEASLVEAENAAAGVVGAGAGSLLESALAATATATAADVDVKEKGAATEDSAAGDSTASAESKEVYATTSASAPASSSTTTTAAHAVAAVQHIDAKIGGEMDALHEQQQKPSSAAANDSCGEWRLPQRSNTAYVRCTLEAFHFLLRRRGVTDLQAEQVRRCLQHCCILVY
jgi:hypothetical protein